MKDKNMDLENQLRDIDFKNIINMLKNGKALPIEYQDVLFPTTHKEYKMQYSGKMRYEEVLSNDDGVQPVPLQLDNIFESEYKWEDDWTNMLFFGDNLQLLKTIYKNEDPLIKNKVKGKVKLIYIDPPSATQDEFTSKNGIKAYSDKKKGSEFIEFIRRRLIVAKEILAEEGSIFVHLDQKMSHYIKIVMDEIFGKHNFRNEIIWKYTGSRAPNDRFSNKHDTILFYSKGKNYFNPIFENYSLKSIGRFDNEDKDGRYKITKKNGKEYKTYLNKEGKKVEDVWDIPIIMKNSQEFSDYPTQKPEELLERIIKSSTNEGDIVLDFFGGSGSTAITSEKLNRKWITCDIGKYSYLTIQKRVIEIEKSNTLLKKERVEVKKYESINNNISLKKDKGKGSREDYNLKDFIDMEKLKAVFGNDVSLSNIIVQQGIENKNKIKKYDKKHRPFITAQLGSYDLDKVFDMDFQSYKQFCSHLFNFTLNEKIVNNMNIDGIKDGSFVEIFPYQEYINEDVKIDIEYINMIHSELSDYIKDKYYIITPANYISFKEDYIEIDNIKYYFLKIPYHMINELHKVRFERTKTAFSRDNLNDINYAIGFHFKIPPEIKREIIKTENGIQLKITSFIQIENNPDKNDSFQNLSSIYIDKDYRNSFILSESYFNKDLKIINNQIVINIEDVGERVFIIYSDINGNETKELINIKDLKNE